MKTFDEWATGNGVKIPQDSFGFFFWNRKWGSVRNAYNSLYWAFRNNNDLWTYKVKELENTWKTRIDATYSELAGEVASFSTPKEALDNIRKFTLPNVDIAGSDIEKKLRKKWIESVIGAAGNGCKLIVIKVRYTPDQNKAKLFEKMVNEREETSIAIEHKFPIWIAFYPSRNIEELGTDSWMVNPSNSTISYCY